MSSVYGTIVVTLEGEQGLERLARVPSTVKKIMIKNCHDCNLELTQLPEHVKCLWLVNVSTTNAVTFPESLDLIYLREVTSAVSMTRWTFPESLQSVTFTDHGGLIDLRAVASPTIIIENLRQTGGEIRLPETLDQLTIDGTSGIRRTNVTFSPVGSSSQFRRVQLPRYLRSLNLWAVGVLDASVATTLEEVSLRYMTGVVDVNKLFPRVRSLELVWINIGDSLRLPYLNSLVTRNCSGVVAFDTPSLESLSIDNFASANPPFAVNGTRPRFERTK